MLSFAGNTDFSSATAKTGTNQNFVGKVEQVSLKDRLKVELGDDLPDQVISLILETTYQTDSNGEVPLFAMIPFTLKSNNTDYVLDKYEIIQIINDYLDFKDDLGEDDAIVKIKEHLQNLALNKKHKFANNILIPSDSVFESPSLEVPRKEEALKRALANRKKIAMEGPCARKGCNSNSLRKEERNLRSGDEALVTISVCTLCGYRW